MSSKNRTVGNTSSRTTSRALSLRRGAPAARIAPLLAAALLVGSPAAARGDVVLEWNARAVSTTAGNPFTQARFLAIVQLAVFEAVNAVTGEYEPYLGTVVAPAGASAEAAAAAAAHKVLVTYFPASTATLDAALAATLAQIPDGAAEDGGVAAGVDAAEKMIANRNGDGSAPPENYMPTSTLAGVWQLTPGCPAAGGVFYHWRNVKPFGVRSVLDFLPAEPPALTSNEYLKDLNEVKRVGRAAPNPDRPQDRTDVATFYAVTSPGFLMSSAATQVSTAQGRSLSDNARALALINMAISDALVASFAAKYHYNYWRPITAIHEAASDGNPKTEADAAFATFIGTPCFPSYPSNHASGSNAGAEMLRRLYGAGGHDITLAHPAAPGISLHYTTFKDICQDIDDARVYGGIHFRFDQEAGTRLGREVATYVIKHNLQKAGTRD
jgi:hypothetical protein